jgi:hypothetical protein
MPWRPALAKPALAGQDHKTMIKLLNPAITGRPDPVHTQSAFSFKFPSSVTRN